MLIPLKPVCRTLALASAVLAMVPAALAQQPGSGPALPPPSLYDEAPPAATPAPVQPTAAPVRPEPRTAPAQVQPAPAAVESTPVAAAAEPMPVQEESARQPWYKSIWPFNRGSKTEQAAAPAPAPAAIPEPPAGRGSPAARGEFAYDSPSRTIRTGLAGECLKTGLAQPGSTAECPGEMQAPAPVAIAEPMRAPAPVEPEPVQVQPLAPAPVQEPIVLEPEPEPVAAPPPAPLPPAPIQTTTLAADATFAVGSFQLMPSARAKLDELAAQLDQFDYQRIHVTGHTDPTGSAQLNERLSRQRAETVKRYLVTKGLPAEKIETEGMGSTMPMVTDKDCSALPRAQRAKCYEPDRRVDIEVSGVTVAHN
jgi:outer membrane protein OmpA-like peptidoglycan-associated protein